MNIWEVRKSLEELNNRISEIDDQLSPLNAEKLYNNIEITNLERFINAYENLCEHDWSAWETVLIDNESYKASVLKCKCNLCGKERVKY